MPAQHSTPIPVQLPFDFPPDNETPPQPTPSSIVIAPPVDRRWLDYFSREAAIQSVAAHIAALGSSRTPEQLTRRSYETGLSYLLSYLGDRLPTLDLMQMFIAHLVQRGLAASTINSKYLAVARHYLKALARQRIPGLHGEVRDFISDCRDEITLASTIKSAARGVTTHQSALHRDDFVRLTVEQINTVLNTINRKTLGGMRDYAMLWTGFTTGLRLSELRRITLGSIKRYDDVWVIVVRRKRNNFDPVVLDPVVYEAIKTWVEAFNVRLPLDDERRIEFSMPVWQPLSRTGGYLVVGCNGYDPMTGLSGQGFRDVVERRTAVLGAEFTCGVHDMRRSVAFNLDQHNVKLTTISAVLGHANVATTDRYIGRKLNVAEQNVLSYLDVGASRAA